MPVDLFQYFTIELIHLVNTTITIRADTVQPSITALWMDLDSHLSWMPDCQLKSDKTLNGTRECWDLHFNIWGRFPSDRYQNAIMYLHY